MAGEGDRFGKWPVAMYFVATGSMIWMVAKGAVSGVVIALAGLSIVAIIRMTEGDVRDIAKALTAWLAEYAKSKTGNLFASGTKPEDRKNESD